MLSKHLRKLKKAERKMFKVRIERKAQKKLAKIKTAILNLANDPRPVGYKKLKGREGYRIRVADYRIIYEVFDDFLLVNVVDLGHRKDIYAN